MKRIFGSIAFAAMLLLAAGCTTTDTVVSANAFQQIPESAPQKASTLVSGDVIELSVEVDGIMEVVAHRAEVNAAGTVTLPLVGDVSIGGDTLDKARDRIAWVYGRYYVNPPVIMVALANSADQGGYGYITVMGQVGKPGRIPMRSASGMNLTAAIQDAGGFATSAKQSAIRVTRTDADGKKIQTQVDFNEIGQGGNADADIKLLDGDIVYVPQRVF